MIDEFWDLEFEHDWRECQKYYSLAELYKIFPEIKKLIPNKMDELSASLGDTKEKLKKAFASIDMNPRLNEDGKWFYREWVEATLGAELQGLLKQIQTFRTLYYFDQPKTKVREVRITEFDIEAANQTPVESLISDRHIRRSGRSFFTNCPFHEEKTPSFCIYPDGKGYFCFGCNEGGNAINFVMKLYTLDFIQAVKFLIRK
jgi:hypothetical protein